MLLQLSNAHSPKQHSPDMPSALALYFPACSAASSRSLSAPTKKVQKAAGPNAGKGFAGRPRSLSSIFPAPPFPLSAFLQENVLTAKNKRYYIKPAF